MTVIIIFILIAISVFIPVCSYLLFRKIFYYPQSDKSQNHTSPEAHKGKIYEPYKEKLLYHSSLTLTLPHTDVYIRSHDRLRLHGKYFEFDPDAPIEILFHGYKGSILRDLGGQIERCKNMGHNALAIDCRACGESEGDVISFGINERQDCLLWINFVIKNINPNARIILYGVSMGASTVLCVSAENLPENVVGIIADCGYSSPKEIIKRVMKNSHHGTSFLYPLARRGAISFGHFDPDEISPALAVGYARVPILFIHGEDDKFVPPSMSEYTFDLCASEKKLVMFKGAGHTLSYMTDPEKYTNEVREFFAPYL